MAQFPLLASIYTDLFMKYKPMYSIIFSNHVAGNIRRYWYTYDIEYFKYKNKYPKNWIETNKNFFYLGIDLVDKYIGYLLNKKNLVII
tara:strand:+ start:746 stop:1009 length:264 start_codon:yes stop_codon:yes gene_type:complete